MARLTLQMQMSIDGKVSSADPELGWNLWNWSPPARWDAKLLTRFNETLASIDHVLLSRPLVEGGYVDHWTRVAETYRDDPDYVFAQRIVDAQKVVATNKPVRGTWDRVSARTGDLATVVNQVKSESRSGIIAFGGTSFAAALLATDLVDELELYVNPAVVAQGDSIFTRPKRFELLDATPFESGMVLVRYAPIG